MFPLFFYYYRIHNSVIFITQQNGFHNHTDNLKKSGMVSVIMMLQKHVVLAFFWKKIAYKSKLISLHRPQRDPMAHLRFSMGFTRIWREFYPAKLYICHSHGKLWGIPNWFCYQFFNPIFDRGYKEKPRKCHGKFSRISNKMFLVWHCNLMSNFQTSLDIGCITNETMFFIFLLLGTILYNKFCNFERTTLVFFSFSSWHYWGIFQVIELSP